MALKRLRRLITVVLAVGAVIALVASASAGRAWCRADPVFTIDGDVVDIQVASSLEMYGAATGPIQMVVTVQEGADAEMHLSDFGFGYGYDIQIIEDASMDAGDNPVVAVFAPASDSSLPVTVHGARVGDILSGLFGSSVDLLWVGDASGQANEWIKLEVR